MDTIGDGILLVIFGSKYIIPMEIIPKTIKMYVPLKCSNCDLNINIPNALTKPNITGLGIYFINLPTFKYPRTTWIIPVSIVAASIYCTPWLLTSPARTKAMDPAAADIIAVLPPKIAVITEIQNDEYTPIIGSTPATIVKPITSGIKAIHTTNPAKRSNLILPNHSFL